MKSTVWISYDLGVSGDYEGIYAWLDDHDALECGSSVAFVRHYDHGNEDLMDALKTDIQGAVDLDKRSRVYVIRRGETGRQKGGYLFGRRKGSPWRGYGQQEETLDDEELMSEASGLSWLGGKTWAQVTREERFFCAELFVVIRQGVQEFVQFLVRRDHWTERADGEEVLRLASDLNWDPAYEVCFYRDMLRVVGERLSSPDSGTLKRIRKRTFDLALFSSEAIILIEAKAHQGFDGKQLKDVKEDRKRVEEWTERKPIIVGLVSSKYTPKCETRNTFDLMISWKDLAGWCGDDERAKRVFNRADEIYRD